MSETSSQDSELRTPLVLEADLPLPQPHHRTFKRFFRDLLNLKTEDTEWRTVAIGAKKKFDASQFPANEVNNRRYSIVTFLPKALYEQFKWFFNIYFLAVAVSQFVPMLQVGFIFIYFAPLAFVVCLSLLKEAVDDIGRWRRDRAANAEKYDILEENGNVKSVSARDIKVGTLLIIHQKQRIPADCILLHTTEKSEASFVRTDQLDGETDWKLRFPVKTTKGMTPAQLAQVRLNIKCEPPHKDIYKFIGVAEAAGRPNEGLNLENTLWCNCVVASGTVTAVVIHTGCDCRSAMNAAKPSLKRGLVDYELNKISYLCFTLLMILSFLLVVQQKFQGQWLVNFVRFQILLSSIIPISMRVNIDIARVWYALVIFSDSKCPGTIVRNTNIPEELGRLSYLFSDKTGTLTKNVMEFRSLQLGPQFTLQHKDVDDFNQALEAFFGDGKAAPGIIGYGQQQIREIGTAVLALALCHNVTPVKENGVVIEFQASSPDEVAMVKFASSVRVVLQERTLRNMVLKAPNGEDVHFEIIKTFPFTSERKCMGIILRDVKTQQYLYQMKGADVKMVNVVKKCDWLDESCQEMAQKGLRTLVFAQRSLTGEIVDNFLRMHDEANAVFGEQARAEAVDRAMKYLETGMNLVCITGVEDQLQDDVTNSLETLGMCGMRVWMLTGDKVETATCIGRSTQLIPRCACIEMLICRQTSDLQERLAFLRQQYDPQFQVGSMDYSSDKWALILDGTTLEMCLTGAFEQDFVEVARFAHSVIVARCSPTQKAAVVCAVMKYCGFNIRTAAIGDGGNDVSMILAAHVGIGVEGVEGKQASMAADFSITKFAHCVRLLMWHGRNSYRRSCQLSQFIMHRGIVYSIVQVVFSLLFAGCTMSVFNGYLLMGYATFFTMAPVFALVLDEDYREENISEFPQLYKELLKSRAMNTRSFLQWVWVSFFQGGVMMYLTIVLLSDELFQIVSIAFTALLVTELVIVAAVVHFRILWTQRRRHLYLFLAAECFSCLMYVLAVVFLPSTFDKRYLKSWTFVKNVLVICVASIGPIFLLYCITRLFIFRQGSRVK